MPVVVESALGGVRAASRTDGGGLAFSAADGAEVLRVQGVTALDARGAAIPAWMAWQDGVLRIGYEDRGAVYPVVLDPLFTIPEEVLSFSMQNNAFLGYSVASAGDVDRDGFADVLVGAYLFDSGQVDEGVVFLFKGKAGGVETVPAWMAESNQGGAQFGFDLAGAGSVNADRYDDVLIGAPFFEGTSTNDGAVFVYFGGPAGLGAAGTPLNADWFAYGEQFSGRFGAAVAFGANLDGSGLDSVVVSAPKQRSAPSAPITDGAVLVWLGGGANSAAATPGTGLSTRRATADVIIGGLQSDSQFGIAVAGPGDINGDGIGDLLVGADLYDNGQVNEGRAFVFTGPLMMPATPSWTAESDQQGAQFGYAVSGAGDVNCDGRADIIIGAPYGAGRHATANVYREGFAVVYLGGPAGPGDASGLGAPGTLTNAAWSAESDQSGARFGWSVAAVPPGRCGGCGGEVLVGAPYLRVAGRTAAGGAFGWESDGSGLGLDGRAFVNADWAVTGDDPNDQAGFAVAGLHDVDGDGQGDAIVGVPYAEGDAIANGGEAHVFLSSGAGNCMGCASDIDCEDFDACTDDACDLGTGTCEFTPVVCDDGNACNGVETCDPATACVARTPLACGDGNACNEVETCDPATGCVAGTPLACDDGDACNGVETCDPATGCVPGTPVACVDDGDPCTDEVCSLGTCTHPPLTCPDDMDACTNDAGCVAGVCSYPDLCDDGDSCTVDACAAGACANAPKDCDDMDACTDDSCEPGTGACLHAPVPIDDGDACTTDACDSVTGVSHVPLAGIDDMDACTTDACDSGTGAIIHTPVPIDDGDACTTDACDPVTGVSHTPVDVDDMDACTTDACDPMADVSHTPVSIDDMNACTADTCDPVLGVSHTPIVCNDGLLCTIDTCNPAIGCVAMPVTCDDMDDCTTDSCDPATGNCVHTSVDCNDMNACTDDSCDSMTGCQNVAIPGCVVNYTICNDGVDNEPGGTVGDVDCADLVCNSALGEDQGAGQCWDGIDNDMDGFTDGEDCECQGKNCEAMSGSKKWRRCNPVPLCQAAACP